MQLVHLVTLLLIVTMAGARYSHQQARQAAVESVPKLVAIIYTGYLHRLSTKYLHIIYTCRSPCSAPPLTPGTSGCCSERCQSWDECLECAYDNYWLCIDQVNRRRYVLKIATMAFYLSTILSLPFL